MSATNEGDRDELDAHRRTFSDTSEGLLPQSCCSKMPVMRTFITPNMAIKAPCSPFFPTSCPFYVCKLLPLFFPPSSSLALRFHLLLYLLHVCCLDDIFKELQRPHDVFILCTKKLRSWLWGGKTSNNHPVIPFTGHQGAVEGNKILMISEHKHVHAEDIKDS